MDSRRTPKFPTEPNCNFGASAFITTNIKRQCLLQWSIGGESPQPLINLVRRYYDNELERLIDPAIKDQIDSRSFDMFKEIAYECISFNLMERPTMGKVVEKIEKALNIQEPQTPARSLLTEFDRNLQTPPYEEIAAFIECVDGDIGFSDGKPVAAFTIYKCLLHWNCLEAEKTIVFHRIIQIILSAIEDKDNNNLMAYWLSNASTLLFLLHKTHQPPTLPPMGFRSSQSPEDDLAEAEHDPELQDQIDNQMACWLSCASTFLFLIRKSLKLDGAPSIQKPLSPTLFCSSTSSKAETEAELAESALAIEVQHVEAKYPALLFELQLTEYVEKMCGIISDNSKKEVGSFLSSSIQASKSGMLGHHSSKNHWHGIVDYLNTLLKTFKENFVPTTIVKKILTKIFSYINVQLFNSFLLYPECCSIANGRYVNEGLAELRLWCREATEKYGASLFDELNHVRQATQFLIIRSKWEISYKRINNLCSILSVSQLHKICTTACFQDKNYLGGGFDEVIASLAIKSEDRNNASSHSLLLKDSSSIHFSVDDLADSLQVEDFANVNPAIGLAKFPFAASTNSHTPPSSSEVVSFPQVEPEITNDHMKSYDIYLLSNNSNATAASPPGQGLPNLGDSPQHLSSPIPSSPTLSTMSPSTTTTETPVSSIPTSPTASSPALSDQPSSSPPPQGVVTRGRAGITRSRKIIDGTVLYDATKRAFMVVPSTHHIASAHPAWRKAMEAEFLALQHINTWSFVPRPPGVNIVGCKWIFKLKQHADGSLDKHKAVLWHVV
ncbi:unnamed protein product [Lactuca virosa]|uniref:Dilute domain-containing protein n=1 Tax=Lactuca virosa TaxID=75947 RepID=A0AAU9NTA9_9ASTR|nr:unnamed protein product [Lactuca virosa]